MPNDTQPQADLPPPSLPHPSQGTVRTAAAALVATAIVVAALYLGRDLLVPLVLAALLAFVLAPVVSLLQRARLGKGPAVLIAVALAFVVIYGIGSVVVHQVSGLAESLPSYRATIQQKVQSLSVGGEVLENFSGSIQSMLEGRASRPPAPRPAATADLGVPSALTIARTVVQPLFAPLATVGVVLVFLVFVLLYREDLRDRLVRLVGRQDLHRTILAMNDAARRLSRYFLMQVALNTGFGVFITAALWLTPLPNPVLWGIIAGFMRFVPFIGSFIAVAAPCLLALAVAPGWSLAAVVLLLFIGTDMVVGQLIEPLLYGQSTGLSPIAVILSTAFWAFLWGPVGLLIATPLTVCLVVVGRHVQPFAFLEVVLGDSPPLEPAETFYQRALEGNAKELTRQATLAVAKAPLADYYDRVALPGLALAQADLSRDALAFERLDAIHQQIESLLAAMAQPRTRGVRTPPTVTPGWREEGAVVCLPGRGPLDDLAAAMAMEALREAGFGVSQHSNQVLGAGQGEELGLADARLCCLSVLDGGSSASSIRYLLRRIQRQMPNAAVVVCLWHAAGASSMLGTLRSAGEEETIVLSLGELVALAKAVSARRQDAGHVVQLGNPA